MVPFFTVARRGVRCRIVEPHRSSYSDESDPRWYRGEQQQHAEPEGPGWFEGSGDEGSYRSAGRRGGARMPPGAPPGMAGQMGQWTGEQLLPPMPTEASPRDATQHRDPATMTRESRRAAGRAAGTATAPGGRHLPRRFAAALVLAIATAVFSLPVLRILLDSATGPSLSASGVIASVLALLGLPLFAVGLYGLANGAARTGGAPAHYVWLRPPLAYVAVALVLFVAAGLAAR